MKETINKLLNYGDRVARTDTRYLLKGGTWLAVEQVLSTLMSFGLTIAFANLISAETYGTYKFVLSGMGIIGAFALTGLPGVLTQSVSRGHDVSMIDAFREQMRWSIVLILVSLCGSLYYFIHNNTTLALCFLIIGIFIPLHKSAVLYDSFLVGKKLFKKKAIYSLLKNLIYVSVMLVTILLTKDVRILLLSYMVVMSLSSLFFYLKTKKEIDFTTEQDKELVTHGRHLSFLNGVIIAAQEVDKIIVFHYLGPIKLALYSFALVPVSRISGISSILKNLAAPKLSTRSIQELQKSLPKKIGLLFIGLLLIVVLYVFGSPYLYTIFFSQYSDGILYSQVFSIMLLFSIPSVILSQVFLSHMKKKELYISRISFSVIKILLIVVLTPLFGIWGAITALLASYIINFITLSILLYRIKE
jgi:O-antigen/teichoic acid export membrane protein